jgi:hypothetical protein
MGKKTLSVYVGQVRFLEILVWQPNLSSMLPHRLKELSKRVSKVQRRSSVGRLTIPRYTMKVTFLE